MAKQYNIHRHDGGRVRVGLCGGLVGPQTGANRYFYHQRTRHRRLFIQPELRTLHGVSFHQRCRVSVGIHLEILESFLRIISISVILHLSS